MFSQDFDHFVVEDVSMYQDIPTLEFLSTLEHPPILHWVIAVVASAACPSQSSNLEMTSITFGGSHLWRRWALFSEYRTGSGVIFHNISWKHNTSFPLLEVWLHLRILWMTDVHQWLKVDFFVSCASFMTSFLLWLSPTSKLELSQAFSILYPLRFLHPKFSSLTCGLGISLCTTL